MKVVMDRSGNALYFSRSVIPYPRVETGVPVYRHIGIYGFRREFLFTYASLPPRPFLRRNPSSSSGSWSTAIP